MYEPEIGQAVYGNPWGEFKASLQVEAFLAYILVEIERVFWNKNQKEWDRYEDPKIPNIEYRPYYWGEDEEMAKPNFKFEDVEIRWYKYPGRGMSVNKEMTDKEWHQWRYRCIDTIRKANIGDEE